MRLENFIATGSNRNEKTDFSWTSNAPEQIIGKTGSVLYSSLLPSFTFKYMPDGNKNLRLSYYKSISRPGFFEVIPYLLANEDYTEKGNPYLKYVQADKYDFRFEYFPAPSEQILAGLFYKTIKNPIEYSLQESGTNLYLVPENLGTAINYGFEFDITKYFYKFGIKANYTYTNSKITTPKEVQQKLVPLFEKYKADACFSGHDHDLQHSRPENSSIEYFGVGGGSETRPSGKAAFSKFSDASLGFASVLITSSCLRFTFVNEKGENIYSYEIKK